MKITDDMLTGWRQEFEAELQLEADLRGSEVALSNHEDGTYRVAAVQSAWWGFQAGRRTTPDRECEWRLDDLDNGIWESACGEMWSFIDGGPVENRMVFCHRCGGKLKTAPNGEKG